ncbi:hypothetical protein PVK06_020228 [Gossypium arboreum]|uniref:UBN2 domain-containing protein n=1 Tax=Gossypium arboreum TaxID=29729 RepID=A0ABR0PLT9_GOSAR|nr:hypothetical protein PVK06_020228 [Gossypium arboreum]
MSDRFTNIINSLKAFGKIYPNKEMVKKILNSLPTSWEVKVTIIEKPKDLNSLSIDELIGSLLTYEMKINHKHKKSKKFQRKWELPSNQQLVKRMKTLVIMMRRRWICLQRN